ncbi:21625_t:CDS:1, partial [Dentiscutata erythropus]
WKEEYISKLVNNEQIFTDVILSFSMNMSNKKTSGESNILYKF